MKRSKDSLSDEELSNSDNDEDAKRPKNGDDAGLLNSRTTSTSELRRSSRISQRHPHGRVAKDGDGIRKRVVTEIMTKQQTQVLAKQSPTLQSLPDKVQEKLLAYLDIKSIQELSKSCRFYEQFINDRLHISQSLPFNEEFLSQLQALRSVVKKQVLRFTLNDGAIRAKTLPFLAAKYEQLWYIIESQLAFFHTDKLREIDFAPPSDIAVAGRVHSWDQHNDYKASAEMSAIAMDVLWSSNPRCFMNVTKISLIMCWMKYQGGTIFPAIDELRHVPNLKEFRLFISERIELR